MSTRARFDGEKWRVLVKVYDYSDAYTAELRAELPRFSVHVLPQSAHPCTAFSNRCAEQAYYGDQVSKMWHAVKAYVPGAVFPNKLKKYLT